MSGFWRGKRVLVTGGGGFLGSHVVDQLKAKDCAEVFIVRSRDYDLTHEADVMRLYKDHPADIVMHLAGYVGGIGANKAYPADFFYRNLMMGALVLHNAWTSGAAKVVAAGAGCGYPEFAPQPIKESDYWNGYPQDDSAPYSLAKRMLHVQSMAYWRQHKFPIVVTIPGNIYGEYDNFDLDAAHVIPALVRKFVEAVDDGHASLPVWGSGKPTRDFVYAGDVAEGMILAAERFDEPVLMNLSAGRDHSIREVVDLLTGISGFKGKIEWQTDKPEGQSSRLFDMSVAREKLGFSAHTSLRDGLKKTFDWYRANRARARNKVAAE
jgi:GDP-L-fucose synthase